MTDDTKRSAIGSPRLPDGRHGTSVQWIDLSCCNCGYGVHVRSAPVQCPMCRGAAWQIDDSRPRRARGL